MHRESAHHMPSDPGDKVTVMTTVTEESHDLKVSQPLTCDGQQVTARGMGGEKPQSLRSLHTQATEQVSPCFSIRCLSWSPCLRHGQGRAALCLEL